MRNFRKRHHGPKSQPVNPAVSPDDSPPSLQQARQHNTRPVKSQGDGTLQSHHQVGGVLTRLFAECQASDAAAALIPWFCDALASEKSRHDYFRDLERFLGHMNRLNVHPYAVTGDHVRLYKEALLQGGKRPASVARAISVIRGTYEQFGKKGLVPWNVIGDIQAVSAPRVTKNTTPLIGEADACRMLHAPDQATPIGCRDHALLFTYFKTACRSSAIARATLGDLIRNDTEWLLRVTEKGKKERLLPLLEAAPAVLKWLHVAEISAADTTTPLFPAFERDRKTPSSRPLSRRQILNIVKKYAAEVGLTTNPGGRRGICTHSLRKTSAVNALQHGAGVHEVQSWLGHADIRTTQEYISYREKDVEAAARRCQIR